MMMKKTKSLGILFQLILEIFVLVDFRDIEFGVRGFGLFYIIGNVNVRQV